MVSRRRPCADEHAGLPPRRARLWSAMTRSDPSADPRQAGRALKQGAVLSVLTGVTLVGAAAYQFVVAALFGTGVGVDVYLGVLAVPTLLVGGATHVFNVSVLPEVVRAREQVHASGPPLPRAGEDGPLVRTWITVALLVAALLGAVGALAAPWVVRVALPGFPAAQAPLATRLFQITLIGLLLQGISQILGSIQNARHRFFVPAAAGALYLGANFAALLLLWRPLGAVSIAVGTLLGGALSAGWLLGLEVHRYGYRPALRLDDEGVRAVGRAALPLVLTVYVGKSAPVLEWFFASQISLQAVAYLGYAERLITYYTTFTASGLVTTLFTLGATFAARDEWARAAEVTVRAVRLITILCIPAVAAIVFLRAPLLSLLFERGAFSSRSAVGVGDALLGYSGVLIFASLGSVVSQVFYLRKQTHLAAAAALTQPLVYLAIAPPLIRIGSYTGLAIASSGAWAVVVGLLYWLASRRVPGLVTAGMLLHMLKVVLGSVGAGALTVMLLDTLSLDSQPLARGALVLATFAGLAVFLLGRVLRLPEIAWVLARLGQMGAGLAARVSNRVQVVHSP